MSLNALRTTRCCRFTWWLHLVASVKWAGTERYGHRSAHDEHVRVGYIVCLLPVSSEDTMPERLRGLIRNQLCSHAWVRIPVVSPFFVLLRDLLVPPARAVQRSIRTRPGHCLLMSSLRLATKQHNVVVAKAPEKQELRTPRVCTCRAGSSHSVTAKSCHGLLRCQLQRFGQPCMEASGVLHTAQHQRAPSKSSQSARCTGTCTHSHLQQLHNIACAGIDFSDDAVRGDLRHDGECGGGNGAVVRSRHCWRTSL